MDRNEFMELVYETFADEPDNVLANGIIEAADAYAEHEKAQLSQEGTTKDAISRQAAIDGKISIQRANGVEIYSDEAVPVEYLKNLPSVQPEQQHGRAFKGIVVKYYPSYNTYPEYKGKPYFSIKYTEKGQSFIGYGTYNPEVLSEYLKEYFMPPIQPEPHEGHWIPHETPDGGEQYECSRCGVLWEFNDGTPEDNEAYFCPKCGKKLITK